MTRRYLTPSRLIGLAAAMSARDRAVVGSLLRVRVATGAQLRRLHYADVGERQARAALAVLTQQHLLARLPRVVGGVRAGSAGYVYTLGAAGWRLMRPEGSRRGQPWAVGAAFVAHTLDVTELYVRLAEAQRDGRLEVRGFVTEPQVWRTFVGAGGGRVTLKPDAHTRLVLGRYEDQWFIEVDRGTEAAATIARKCEVYRRYWQSGQEQTRHQGVFPKVLWTVPDQRRYDQLVAVLARQPAEAWPLFAVAVFDDAVARLEAGALS